MSEPRTDRRVFEAMAVQHAGHALRLTSFASLICTVDGSTLVGDLAALPVPSLDGLRPFDWDQAEPALIEAFTEVITDNPPDNALMVTTVWAFEVLTALSDRGYVLAALAKHEADPT